MESRSGARADSAATHVGLADVWAVAELVGALRDAGAGDAVQALASRAGDAGMFDLFLEIQPDRAASYRFGREPDGTPSQRWKWEEAAVPSS